MNEYDTALKALRAPLPSNPTMQALVRFATLAANGHNTQPWQFAVGESGFRIVPDFTRRTPIVDPDDHHLFCSLGCAAENLMIAAKANGHPSAFDFDEHTQNIHIDLTSAPSRDDPLYRAIPLRQSTRSIYDARDIAPAELKLLEAAAKIEGVSMQIITDVHKRETVMDYLIQANSAQMDNAAFVEELRNWIRFNPAQALAMRDGLYSKAAGSPVVPTWIGERMFGLFFKKASETKKYIAQIRSSSGIAIFIGDKADKTHWIKVGRSFQRFALQATVLGIRHAHLNQIVEIPDVRHAFANWLGARDPRPDLVVRFGRAPPMPMSLRRPTSAVILPPMQ